MSEDIPFDEAATLLGLMANDSRLRIFELITQREWDVGSLAVTLHISQSALSQHLKKMRVLVSTVCGVHAPLIFRLQRLDSFAWGRM